MNLQPENDSRIAVIGGGSMGTALAALLAAGGDSVTMWVYERELVDRINGAHENDVFLPGVRLPESIVATGSLALALRGARTVFSVTPAQVARSVWSKGREFLEPDADIVSASKGVETGTAKLMSELLEEELSSVSRDRFAFLSGPSFAKEIAAGQPTAVVVASTSCVLAERIQRLVSRAQFRAYTTDDVVGVELGGALKNVIAIAVGAADGMGLGLNARAALITRGLAEVTRLAVACGGNPLTLAGLAGVGDLVLTCTGHLSRNLQVGIRLGKKERLDDILGSMTMVAEGVATARSAMLLAKKFNVEMPITAAVTRLLDGELGPDEAVRELMGRKLKFEREH